MSLGDIIDLDRYPITDSAFRAASRKTLEQSGVVTMPGFLRPHAVEKVRREGEERRNLAYFNPQEHNVYLTPPDPSYPMDHPRNRLVTSSKGCITDDQIPAGSPLHEMYDSDQFRAFLCAVLGEERLYDYDDTLSSINLHYADQGQELGWHFDNSSFAITLMIQEPEHGGTFDYIEDMRDADAGEMNFDGVEKVLDGKLPHKTLQMNPGDLVLFRGRNSIHRVAPVEGRRTRMLVVLAYNSEPGIALSESARMTFYGRLD